MNKIFAGAVVALLFAGCATTDQYDIRPDATKDSVPTAVEWQNANDKVLKEATKGETIASFVASDKTADALLAKVKGAYTSDPVVLTQIACVTQLTLCSKCPKAPEYRRIWVAALERRIASTQDDYVKTFCTQQLWLCK